jgi:hypothetical protein
VVKIRNKMKNTEIIKVTALIILAAALLYRKYGKKKKTELGAGKKMPGTSILSSNPADDDYEPYSNKAGKV